MKVDEWCAWFRMMAPLPGNVCAWPLLPYSACPPPRIHQGGGAHLGVTAIETILLTCCLGQAFPAKTWVLDPAVFWRHSSGCAMVCRKFSEKLAAADGEKAYMAGLLHDIGFMVNSLAFSGEFITAMERACGEEIRLGEAEYGQHGIHALRDRAGPG